MAEGPDGVLLLDKPAGFSSTQALARAKRFLAARKAGHTGTLDPFATGLLPVVFGEATKFSRFLIDARKSYRATLQLGIETTTGDTEGSVTRSTPCSTVSSEIDEVLRGFTGVRDQVPPMHSAVRLQGKRLYEFAREGQEVERAARRIEITALARVEFAGSQLVVDVTCSKGTYVRTLAEDIGRALGCGAHLSGLRRTAVGRFRLEDACDLAELEAGGVDSARARLLPLEVLVEELPRREGSAEEALRFAQGQVLDAPGLGPGDEVAVFAPTGRFVGVGRAEVEGRLAPLRLLATGPSKLPDFA
ncbi:MAG TPA: tRNA pseudouridine(55) synthase TruB [Usitatibacter sp.]|nr:tRNA pseudouridine(55) synthase TruB [Usitatibacter sp.]